MSKIDLRKEFKPLYTASAKKASIIDVPKLKYLMIGGTGHPDNSPAFQQAMEALFSLAYTLKFSLKLGPTGEDWTMMPVEGLWWADGKRLEEATREDWRWTLMILQPDIVTAAMLRQAKKALKRKKDVIAAEQVTLEAWREGKAIQMMHVGSYLEEGPTVERLVQHARANGHDLDGKHHEIYFSDPRRTPPEKLKTILRHPVQK